MENLDTYIEDIEHTKDTAYGPAKIQPNPSWSSIATMKKVIRNGHSFHVNADGYEKFWDLFEAQTWEPATTDIFDIYIDENTTFIDIGAWIGPTLFYAAQIAGKCFAVEADPIAFRRLEENHKLNSDANWFSNIELINKAISDQVGQINFGSRAAGGDSMSSILWGDLDTSWQVDTINVHQLIDKTKDYSKRLFVKIDIEGGEFTMLDSLKHLFALEDATIHLSLHNIFLKRSLALKYKHLNFIKRFFKIRSEFAATYRELFDCLPNNKDCSMHGRPLTQSPWVFLNIWLFCKPPKEKKYRDILITPRL